MRLLSTIEPARRTSWPPGATVVLTDIADGKAECVALGINKYQPTERSDRPDCGVSD